MKIAPTIKKIKELLAVLDPYANSWKEWTSCGACFLTPEDQILIQNFLLTGSHLSSSIELNISMSTASSRLKKIKQRLVRDVTKFEDWQTQRLLEDSGIIVYTSETDRFLNSPFDYLEMPLNIKRKLKVLSAETMKELLEETSEENLKRYRNMGNKTIEEFKVYLNKNGCLHYLKKHKKDEK